MKIAEQRNLFGAFVGFLMAFAAVTVGCLCILTILAGILSLFT